MIRAGAFLPFSAPAGRTGIASLDRILARHPDARAERLLPPSPGRDRTPADRRGLDRWILLRLGASDWAAEAAHAIALLPEVETSEIDGTARGAGVIPNDRLFPEQWHLQNRKKPGADIHATEAWEIGTGSDSILVAIIDSGIRSSQPDLSPRMWVNPGETPENAVDDDRNGYVDDVHGWNFVEGGPNPEDDIGHGSFVAGILGAASNNDAGITGVDWRCRLLPLRVLGPDNEASYSSIVRAVVYALRAGARVLNVSLGGTGFSAALQEAMLDAHDMGAVVCAAIGNENSDTPFYPAACPFVVAVGATDEADRRAVPFTAGDGSSYGRHLKLVAPGQNIFSTYGSSYAYGSGTSFATPQVSGAVSLLWSVAPSLGNDAVVQALTANADDQVGDPGEDRPGFDPYFGYGRLNLERALRAVAPAAGSPQPAGLQVSLAPNPAARSARVSLSLPRGGLLEADLFDVAGRIVRRLSLGPHGPGPVAVDLNLARLPGGAYFLRARLRSDGTPPLTAARKLLLVR